MFNQPETKSSLAAAQARMRNASTTTREACIFQKSPEREKEIKRERERERERCQDKPPPVSLRHGAPQEWNTKWRDVALNYLAALNHTVWKPSSSPYGCIGNGFWHRQSRHHKDWKASPTRRLHKKTMQNTSACLRVANQIRRHTSSCALPLARCVG